MLILFWVIVVLVGVLLTKNARYAIRRYASDRNRLLLTLYFVFLVILGTMIIHITSRVISLVQAASEDTTAASPIPHGVRPVAVTDND